MNISEIFIKRPIMTTLLMVWIVLMSTFAYQKLPVNALPRVEFPVIVVTASLPGASAETMAQAVSLPLEQQFSAIPGLDVMTSSSAQETTQITLQFNLDVNINTAAQDVGTSISTAQRKLPTTMVAPPTFKKINPSEQPVIILALRSDTMPIWKLNQFSDTLVVPRLAMLPNVARVDTGGRQKYAVRISVNPEALRARGIGIDQVARDVSSANINSAAGMLQGKDQVYSISPNTDLSSAKEFSDILINNQHTLRLKDIATVSDDTDSPYTAAWYNTDRSIILLVGRQPGANSIEVADSVKAMLPEIQKQLPASIKLDVIVDRTESIKESVKEVKITGFLTIALVVFVIFIFLGNCRATLIPSLSLPISILMTFSGMYFMDFSLNNLTLLALTLSTGFIIDDAIVVLENIIAYREKGLSAKEAAFKGSREIAFTVISMTLSLVAVFIPVLFMQGIVGRFLYEFAMTIAISILASGFVSLTLIPMMSQYLAPHHEESRSWLVVRFKLFYERMESAYKKSLAAAFKLQRYIMHFVVAIFIANVVFYAYISKGFFPNEDTGLIYGVSEVLPETSFESMKKIESRLIHILSNNKEIESFNTSIGQSTSTIASNEGRFFIVLKPIGKRRNIQEIMNDLRKAFYVIPDLKVSMQSVQNLRIGGSLSKSQYQYTLQTQNFKDLARYTNLLESIIQKTPDFLDVNTDLKMNSLQANVKIDRDIATRLGLSIQKITEAIGYAYSDQQISTIYTESDTYSVIIGIDKEESKSIADLSKLYVSNNEGTLIPLSAFATVERKNAPLLVNHLNRLAAATISFNLAPGKSLGDAVIDIKKMENKIKLPATINTSFQGTAKAFQSSQGGQVALILSAIFTIYIILGILYESYRHPITILSGLPSAGLGALIFLWLFGFDLDVIGIIGIILLIGIVKKNAIMMIDYALECQRIKGFSSQEAIIEACHRRFRPIMMTTFAAIVGALPIAFWDGSGAEFRRPLGVCIIGGLLVSQWLTLYITPLFYVWIDERKKNTNNAL
ncbi:MAG: efflux RND transporter permease subunit [Candidatus Paracaedibacteraceae bacterium]|nr:efflux RND transporter permease subunit [Candidatus Paracaedibacteraceae bacterium]